LVDKANQLWSALSPGAEPITARLARHYQQTGVLGRGVRHGRSSLFFAQDVASLVAAKSMAQDRWPQEQVQKLLTSDYSGSPSPASSANALSTEPVALIDRLLEQARGAKVAPSLPSPFPSSLPAVSAACSPALSHGPANAASWSKSFTNRSGSGEALASASPMTLSVAGVPSTDAFVPHSSFPLGASAHRDLTDSALALNSLYRQNRTDNAASAAPAAALPSSYPVHVIDLDPQLQVFQRSTAPRDRRRHAALLRRLADDWDPPAS
jgi:hypothetical protein